MAIGVLAGLPTGAEAAATAPAVRIVKIQYDSPGADTRSAASLNAEWVALRNTTARSVSLSGWTLRDAQNHVYAFGTLTVAARATIYVHTGKGRNTAANRYWGSGNYVWNNPGDTATLRDPRKVVQTCGWRSTGKGSITC
ncbi:MAG TPA: lamin tail domain-containing protein [Mycobacteriales bacterium]|nr:lamin tail domain-containing protein [Mycobacteriales bacterium]